MRTLQRILAFLCILLALGGLVAFVGGVLGIWVVRTPLTETSTRVLGRVEHVLGRITRGLDDLDTALGKAEENLRQYRSVPKGADSGPDNETLKLVAWSLNNDVVPNMGNVRQTLMGVSASTVVINSLLADVNELPHARVASLDADKLQDISDTLSRLGSTAQQLSGMLKNGKTPQCDAAATRMQDGLATVRTTVTEYESRLSEIRDRITSLKAELPRDIHLGAIILTVVFLWLAFSQVSVLMHGWGWLRGGASTAGTRSS